MKIRWINKWMADKILGKLPCVSEFKIFRFLLCRLQTHRTTRSRLTILSSNYQRPRCVPVPATDVSDRAAVTVNSGAVGSGTAIQAGVWGVQSVAQLVEALRYKPESGVYKAWCSWLRHWDTSRSLGCTKYGAFGWGTAIQDGVLGVQGVAQLFEALRYKPESGVYKVWRSCFRHCDTSRSLGCTKYGHLVKVLRYKPESGVYKAWCSWLRHWDTSRNLGCTKCGAVGWSTTIEAEVWGVKSVAQLVEALRFKPESGVYKMWRSCLKHCETNRSLGCTKYGAFG